MVKLAINGKIIESSKENTILQVAIDNNIEIPHMCYDKRLKSYGGCGMCVVEVEGSSKLMRACSTNVYEGMEIETHTKRTHDARKIALDLYVSDHRGDCLPPCTLGCPARTDIQGYVGLIANGQYVEAVKLIKQAIPIPASIGRVCPHPCESECRRDIIEEPISVATLKYFAADIDLFNDKQYIPNIANDTNKKIAIIGAGPAGLSAAYFLRTKGHNVSIFEAMAKPGGMLRYGIPEYRLPKDIIDREVAIIEDMGVKINYNIRLGEDLKVKEIQDNFDASFIAIGAWKSSSMRCKGEDLNGVIGGIDFLQKVAKKEHIDLDERVVVVGGGNTAMDVARTCVRLGVKEVRVLYRRTESEMPAQVFEIQEAKEEGVIFDFLVAPIEVTEKNGVASGVICQKMELGKPDASGRRRPIPIEGETSYFETSTIISAIGQKVTLGNIQGIETTDWGTIVVDELTYQTNIEGIFSGGDSVTGPKDAIDAIAAGKNAANLINSYLNGHIVPRFEQRLIRRDDMTISDYPDVKSNPRVHNEIINPEIRKINFDKVMHNYTEQEALSEASRCLECGCKDVFECDLLKNIKEHKIDTNFEHGEQHRRVQIDDHPFIQRDSDKCIQCAQCVRVCDEVVGETVLGIVDRGFESLIAPESCLPLSETSCVSCGACIDICPTGALKERLINSKEIPLDFDSTDSVCTHCSLGCLVTYHYKDNRIYRVTPNNDDGVLCVKGKFEFEYINSDERIVEPIIKDSFDSSKLENVGFILSPSLLNEDFIEIKELGNKLGTNYIGTIVKNIEEEIDLDKLSRRERIDLITSSSSIYKQDLNYGGASKANLMTGSEIISKIKSGDIKNLVLVGVTVSDELLALVDGLDNLIVMSLFHDESLKNADVILPLRTSIERSGNINRIDGQNVEITKVLDLLSCESNKEELENFFKLS
ncbi:FAD-dependent oxidoreductase [Mycoplasmatota bacterium zrk1]